MKVNIIQAMAGVLVMGIFYVGMLWISAKKMSMQKRSTDLVATAYSRALCQNGGYRKCKIPMTRSGATDTFFDVDQWGRYSNNLDMSVAWIEKIIGQAETENNISIDTLVFVEKDSGPIGMISTQHMISEQLGLRSCVVRLRKWPFLPQAAVKGFIPDKGTKVAVISDVATTGGHLLRTADVLQHPCFSIDVCVAIVLLNRGGEKVVKELKDRGIILYSNKTINKEFEKERNIAVAS